jgi:hypothetical protein
LVSSYLGQLECLNSEAFTNPYITASGFAAPKVEDELGYYPRPFIASS